MPLLAAGVAFYAFLSIFPALIAIVSIYGLFADPATITNQLNSMTAALPEQAKQVITDQVTALASRRSTLGIGLVISVAIALWSASAGINNLLTAITVAYDEEEKRGFVKKRLMSLGLTLGAIVFMVIMLGIVAVLPPLLKAVFGTGVLRWVFQILGWLVLVVLVAVALAILIGWGRPRRAPHGMGIGWRHRRYGTLARCLDRVLDLYLYLRQLRQDLWRFRRNRGAAVLALDQHVRGLARCRDQCRVRAANDRGHDQGSGEAARRARRGESRFGPQRGSRGAQHER